MRVELTQLVTKGAMRPMVLRAYDYVRMMRDQHKEPERVVVSRADYDRLEVLAHRLYPSAHHLTITCNGIPVFHSASDPLPQPPPPPPPPPPRIEVPGYADPFGLAVASPVHAPVHDDPFDDDEIPF